MIKLLIFLFYNLFSNFNQIMPGIYSIAYLRNYSAHNFSGAACFCYLVYLLMISLPFLLSFSQTGFKNKIHYLNRILDSIRKILRATNDIFYRAIYS